MEGLCPHGSSLHSKSNLDWNRNGSWLGYHHPRLEADASLHKNELSDACRQKTTDISQEQHFTLLKRASFEYLDKLKSSLADFGFPSPSSETAPQILSGSQAGWKSEYRLCRTHGEHLQQRPANFSVGCVCQCQPVCVMLYLCSPRPLKKDVSLLPASELLRS